MTSRTLKVLIVLALLGTSAYVVGRAFTYAPDTKSTETFGKLEITIPDFSKCPVNVTCEDRDGRTYVVESDGTRVLVYDGEREYPYPPKLDITPKTVTRQRETLQKTQRKRDPYVGQTEVVLPGRLMKKLSSDAPCVGCFFASGTGTVIVPAHNPTWCEGRHDEARGSNFGRCTYVLDASSSIESPGGGDAGTGDAGDAGASAGSAGGSGAGAGGGAAGAGAGASAGSGSGNGCD